MEASPAIADGLPDDAPELTVIIVSYNTRALTLKAIETLYANTHRTRFRCVVYDNASSDGSAEAIAAAFPQVELIASTDNLGFARANNVVAAEAETPWILLLNPDTETYEGAVDALLDFSRANPQAGVTGGRTFFPDGRLNPLSCQGRITLWSSLSRALGLSQRFPNSALLNPEGYGDWPRDSVREVDTIVGCLMMVPKSLWDRLGGFDLRYYMYGEDSDLCLRAQKLGYRPMITPEARIMHLVGASTSIRSDKLAAVAKARATLVRDHWPAWKVPFGIAMLWLWGALRYGAAQAVGLLGARHRPRAESWAKVWAGRRDWLAGY